MRERVAVTGVGAVSALGHGASATFEAVVAGNRGFGPLTLFDASDARARIAAEVRGLDIAAIAPRAEARDFSRTDAMALAAGREALGVAGAPPLRLGLSLGGTTGAMLEAERELVAGPLDRVEPRRAGRLLSHPLNLTTERVARLLGGARRRSTLCAACSSSALAIAQGVSWLAAGEVDVVLAGGADGLCRLTFFGFDALGALDPAPCRPFDAARQGLGLGEGAAFLRLEREGAARARGAEILAFVSGTATGSEAHHITHPEPSGALAADLLVRALEAAGLSASELDYVNAHGTGTLQNDAMEARALRAALGASLTRVLVSSTKGQLGHTLGAAGALEAVITVLALVRGVVPSTAGLEHPEDAGLAHVLGRARPGPLRTAASCSFGFGGTGAVLLFEHAAAEERPRPELRCERVVVTGFAALGSFGELEQAGVERVFEPGREARGGPLEPAPLAALDPERSRRFDGNAALVTRLAQRALAVSKLDSTGVGIAAGTAFGSVERSVRFVLRAVERGVRRANPAEFPHLVASAAAGNASIYLGLSGAAFCVPGGATSAEAALAAALDWLRLGGARAFVAGAAEGFDAVAAELLGPRVTLEGRVERTEGGGFVVLEPEPLARARGAESLALLEGPWLLEGDAPFPTAPPRDRERALVIGSGLDDPAMGFLARSAWGGCARRSVLSGSGFHEALSGVALAAAVALVARHAVEEVLVVNGSEHGAWLTLLRCPEVGR
jgi:3-oxoacyl-[acyl-carrier-protein] synthase II